MKLSKKDKRDIICRYKLKEDKAKHPNQCYCEREGIDVERNECDTFVRKTTIAGAHPIYSPNPREVDVRICNICGKEYLDYIIVAYAVPMA